MPGALQAQPQITPEQIGNLPLVAPSEIPLHATFWEWFYGRNGEALAAPLPANPYGPEVPVYYLGEGQYLINNGPGDLNLFQQQRQLQNAMGLLQPMDAMRSDDEAESSGTLDQGFAPGTFYISSISVAGQVINLVLTNTTQGINYQILSKNSLLGEGGWASEGVFPGLDESTPISLWMGQRTNQLFLTAQSLPNDDGTGIPNSWLQQYGLAAGTDPYTFDWCGDGYTLFDVYERNWRPGDWHTPSAPRCFKLDLDSSHSIVIGSWTPSDGAVTGYRVERCDPSGGTTELPLLPTNQTSFTDSYAFGRRYRVQALYGSHDPSAWSPTIGPNPTASRAYVLRGPLGRNYVAMSWIPDGVAKVNLTASWNGGSTNFDIPLASFTNHIAQLPDMTFIGSLPAHWHQFDWALRTVDANETPSTDISLLPAPLIPFFDGRAQLKDNLAFLVRNVTSAPFAIDDLWTGFETPADYAYSSYCGAAESIYASDNNWWISEFRPFVENYFYRNLVFSPLDVDSTGWLTNVDSFGYAGPDLIPPLSYTFTEPTSLLWNPPSSLLSQGNDQWTITCQPQSSDSGCVYLKEDDEWGMIAGYTNYFGLAYSSAILAYGDKGDLRYPKLVPGGTVPDAPGYFYGATEQPEFLTTSYYFARLGMDPLPGDVQAGPQSFPFSPTKKTSLMVVPLGEPLTLAGYAQQLIRNGDPSKPVYLGQYFDKAFLADTNGSPAKETGLLSEYGEFLPTEPGLNILTTKPDLTQLDNLQGQCPLYVISMATDVNRDGIIDSTFGGQDFTTPEHPFRFWINDNDDSGDDQGTGIPLPTGSSKANNYTYYFVGHSIDLLHGTRDLVDWFPVCINVQNLLKSNTNLVLRLSHADDTLNFVETSLDPMHYLDYLTSATVAQSVQQQSFAGPIKPTGPLYSPNGDRQFFPFSRSFVSRLRDQGQGVILVEALAATTAPLVLEVWQGTNMLASTSLYLSITNVEQMFRHKNLVRETFPNAGSAGAPADRLSSTDVPNEPETNDKSFVFVHGYNVNPNQARGNAADVFKRLFWAGSHAKFYAVTWRGSESQHFDGLTPDYHTNVANAFLTAPHLKDFLATITNGQTVVAAHSLGNMVALSAMNDFNAPFDKYFMIDAAVATEAIDAGVSATLPMVHPDWISGTYDRRLWASSWYELFAAGDGRHSLTWSNRLANLPYTNIYNFYSSGEEVLRQHDGAPPSEILQTVIAELGYLATHKPTGIYAWAFQEKSKGRATFNGVLGSTHGGWGFNYGAYFIPTNIEGLATYTLMPSSQANFLADSQLRTNAFFDTSYDVALFGANGDEYAKTNHNRILADAIPALTLPIGANPVPILETIDHNFDMQASFETGWPANRPLRTTGAVAAGEWHHSDFRQVAYAFTHKLYEEIVNEGDLK